MAYYSIEPFGEERADLRSGILASLIYNTNKKPSSPAKSAVDFMPFRSNKDEPQINEGKSNKSAIRSLLKRAASVNVNK